MKPGTRACVAYIAGRAISESSASHVYDYSQSKYIAFSGSVDGASANVYDYDRRCYCAGNLSQLFDYGNRAYLEIRIEGDRFSGYDYDSRKHFEGTVSGASISLYDYDTSAYYSYSV